MIEKILNNNLKNAFPDESVYALVDDRNIATLTGEVSSWQMLVDIGHFAAKEETIRNVVSNMTVEGETIPKKDYSKEIEEGHAKGVIRSVDVVIIGAGISGCGIARELSKYDLGILVVEKDDDVASGASKANNGCIHHGMDCKPNTLKSKLNILGNKRYDDWNEELNINLLRCGALEIATSEKDMPLLMSRYEQGIKNGVPGIEVVEKERAYEIEPALIENHVEVYRGLYMPSHGVVETPYVCIALAENAATNGVEFIFNCTVGAVLCENTKVTGIVTDHGVINAKYVINAAGLYADDIAQMAGDCFYTLHNRRGTITIYDKSLPPTYKTMMAILNYDHIVHSKGSNSKGGSTNRTPENNLLAGPSAEEVIDKEDVESSRKGLDFILSDCLLDAPNQAPSIIKMFAGARPADFNEDFIIEMSEIIDGFVHVAGIQSPGIAAAPAIADMVVGIITDDMKSKKQPTTLKTNFNPHREQIIEFRHMSHEQQAELVSKDSRYGHIICRCEQITEGEILDALKSPLPPHSINAVKNRVRAGMGRCQGGFCQPRVLEILAKEHRVLQTDITLKGIGSNILLSDNRKGIKK